MVDKSKQEIEKLFKRNKGFVRTNEMLSAGLHTREIKRLKDSGWMIKIKQGFYRKADNPISNQSFIDVTKIMPDGVIFLTSALSYYELTTFIPSVISMAILRGTWKPNVEYPPIDFYTLSKKQFNLGISEININNHRVRIYDIEKTICDCFRYRNKIGIDMAKEALSEYLKRKDRNLEKLLSYADICRIKSIVETWLQAMV